MLSRFLRWLLYGLPPKLPQPNPPPQPPTKPIIELPQVLPALLYSGHDLEIGGKTVWGEARGQPYEGLVAVAWVIRNRVERGGWYGKTVADVCLKPYQFSCWNENDPNLPKILKVTDQTPHYLACRDVMRAVLKGQLADPTSGSTHYCTTDTFPRWAIGKEPVAVIGDHKFYNDIE